MISECLDDPLNSIFWNVRRSTGPGTAFANDVMADRPPCSDGDTGCETRAAEAQAAAEARMAAIRAQRAAAMIGG